MPEPEQVTSEKAPITVSTEQAALNEACAKLEALIQAIKVKITELERLLAGSPTSTDLAGAQASIGGMSKNLSEIEDDVISVKEDGGGMQPQLVCPASCGAALAEVPSLKDKLSALEDAVDDKIKAGTGT
jgi:predicted trehalose synthase